MKNSLHSYLIFKIRMLELSYVIGIHMHTYNMDMLRVFFWEEELHMVLFSSHMITLNDNEYALLLKSVQMPWQIEKVTNLYTKVSLSNTCVYVCVLITFPKPNPIPYTLNIYPDNLFKIQK